MTRNITATVTQTLYKSAAAALLIISQAVVRRGDVRSPKPRLLSFDHSRIDPKRETVLLITHQASRTGAPILAYNVAMRLRHKYNVVAVLLAGGELVDDFHACCAAVVGPLAPADLADAAGAPGEAKHLVKHILATYRIAYAIVNSISSWIIVPSLARAFVPVVLLVHEFASYTRPKSSMRQGLDSGDRDRFFGRPDCAFCARGASEPEMPTNTHPASRALRSAASAAHE